MFYDPVGRPWPNESGLRTGMQFRYRPSMCFLLASEVFNAPTNGFSGIGYEINQIDIPPMCGRTYKTVRTHQHHNFSPSLLHLLVIGLGRIRETAPELSVRNQPCNSLSTIQTKTMRDYIILNRDGILRAEVFGNYRPCFDVCSWRMD